MIKWHENKNGSGYVIYKEDRAFIYIFSGSESIELQLVKTDKGYKTEIVFQEKEKINCKR